jgi:dTDP-4-amino-4,6-dideoxygalactose transaminase
MPRPKAKSSRVLDVPFVDLSPVHGLLKDRLLTRIAAVIDAGDFTNGAAVSAFEERFAEYCGTRYCVGVASGLDALRLSLRATRKEEGEEIAVPAFTFAATFEAVLQAGAIPVPVDIGESDLNIDPDQIPLARCAQILPVHLYGQLADMQRISRTVERGRHVVVEDACQAHGATRDGLRVGEVGRATAFSFYPAKNLGAMGDAGAVVTNDEELAARVRALRVHGETSKYDHAYVGYTARLDTVQAIVLLEKLPLLDEWNRQRSAAARCYAQALADLAEVELPPVPAGSEPVWHLFVIRVEEPENLAAFLAGRGIRTARHYPVAPHLAPAYADLGYAPGDFPVAESLSRKCLSLPLFPGIRDDQLAWVIESVHAFYGTGR